MSTSFILKRQLLIKRWRQSSHPSMDTNYFFTLPFSIAKLVWPFKSIYDHTLGGQDIFCNFVFIKDTRLHAKLQKKHRYCSSLGSIHENGRLWTPLKSCVSDQACCLPEHRVKLFTTKVKREHWCEQPLTLGRLMDLGPIPIAFSDWSQHNCESTLRLYYYVLILLTTWSTKEVKLI